MHANMKKLTGSFRYTQWDPWLIIAQIVSVQCIVYLSLGLLLTLFGIIIDDNRTLDHVFEYHVRVLSRLYLHALLNFICTGNTSTWRRREDGNCCICSEFFYWVNIVLCESFCVYWLMLQRCNSMVHRGTDEAVPRFQLYVASDPSNGMLVLQWTVSDNVFVVGA